MIPFPKPRIARRPPSDAAYAKMTPTQRKRVMAASATNEQRTLRFLTVRAFGLIKDSILTEGADPDIETLSADLVDIAEREGAEYPEALIDILRLAEVAAGWALRDYDHGVYVRAFNGGKASAKWSVEHLYGLEHLSLAKAAEAIGCSRRTVAYLRAEQRGALEQTTETAPEPIRETIPLDDLLLDAVTYRRAPFVDDLDALLVTPETIQETPKQITSAELDALFALEPEPEPEARRTHSPAVLASLRAQDTADDLRALTFDLDAPEATETALQRWKQASRGITPQSDWSAGWDVAALLEAA